LTRARERRIVARIHWLFSEADGIKFQSSQNRCQVGITHADYCDAGYWQVSTRRESPVTSIETLIMATKLNSIEKGLKAYRAGEYKKAFALLYPLAEAGYVEAQYHIGMAFHDGSGVTQDIAESINWFLRAAKQQHVTSALYLYSFFYSPSYGGLHKEPPHPADDLVEAYKWATIAFFRDTPEGQKINPRVDLIPQMTEE